MANVCRRHTPRVHARGASLLNPSPLSRFIPCRRSCNCTPRDCPAVSSPDLPNVVKESSREYDQARLLVCTCSSSSRRLVAIWHMPHTSRVHICPAGWLQTPEMLSRCSHVHSKDDAVSKEKSVAYFSEKPKNVSMTRWV